VEVADGVLCGVQVQAILYLLTQSVAKYSQNRYKTSNALKLHIRLKHTSGVVLAPLKAGKPTAVSISLFYIYLLILNINRRFFQELQKIGTTVLKQLLNMKKRYSL